MSRETRDEHGHVLCCHGRPMTCLECGEDYAAELNQVAPAAPLASAQTVLEPIDYAALDPGIRDVVRVLREAGFETTDSGDGVTKPYVDGCTMPVPNVAAMTTRATMFEDADRMAAILATIHPDWHVEASYSTENNSYVLLAVQQNENDAFLSISQPKEPMASARTVMRYRMRLGSVGDSISPLCGSSSFEGVVVVRASEVDPLLTALAEVEKDWDRVSEENDRIFDRNAELAQMVADRNAALAEAEREIARLRQRLEEA